MAQQRVTCAACGNQEAAGVRFCGRCGAPMQGGGGGARPGRLNNQIANSPRVPGAPTAGGIMQNPAAIAAVLAVVAVVVVIAALTLSGGDDKKGTDPNARRGGNAGGDFPTQVAINPAATATPLAVAVPAPTPVPQPTPAPEPAPQPQPEPQPQPQPAQVPGQRTSPLVNLRMTPGGHGATLTLGTPVQLCYGAAAGVWVRVYDTRSGEVLFPEGPDDGRGDCRSDLAAGPVGVDTVQIDGFAVNANGTRGALRGSATLSIVVVP